MCAKISTRVLHCVWNLSYCIAWHLILLPIYVLVLCEMVPPGQKRQKMAAVLVPPCIVTKSPSFPDIRCCGRS